jgi:hypothetical protein
VTTGFSGAGRPGIMKFLRWAGKTGRDFDFFFFRTGESPQYFFNILYFWFFSRMKFHNAQIDERVTE